MSWRELLPWTAGAVDAATVEEIERRHAEPARVYHGLGHLAALAELFAAVEAGPGWRAPLEVACAMLFHDIVYVPARVDNEARSAALARARLEAAGLDEARVVRVAEMILATAAHGEQEVGGDADLAHFLDADMAIVGAPAPDYDRYAEGVRREFSAIPDALYRPGRRRFLEAQLQRPALFHSEWFRQRFEVQARENLRRELDSLASAP
jgi:predicted metal-dependent HD superfamily phosphohydrolase